MHLSFNFSIPLTLTMSQIAGICIFSLPQPPAPHPHPICPVSGWVTTGTPSSKLLRGKRFQNPTKLVCWVVTFPWPMRCWPGGPICYPPLPPHAHPPLLTSSTPVSTLLIPQPRNQTLSPSIQRLHCDKQLWNAPEEGEEKFPAFKILSCSEIIIHEAFVHALEFPLEAEGRLLERTQPLLGLSFPIFILLSLFSSLRLQFLKIFRLKH